MVKPRLCILIVNNGATPTPILSDMLSEIKLWQCEAEWATTYSEALTQMALNRHDVVLVTYHSAGFKGKNLVQDAIAQGCQTPIIVLLEQATRKAVDQITASGATDIIFKESLSALYLEHTLRLALNRMNKEPTPPERQKIDFQMLEALPDGVFIHRAGEVLYINSAGAKILKAKTPDEMIGQPIENFVHPDYRALVQTRIQKLLEDKHPAELIEEKYIRLDGQVIDVEVTSVAVFYQGEKAVQAFFKDVTHAKQSEIEREQLLTAEREQREFAEALHDIAIALNSTLNLDEILRRILTNVGRVVPHDAADIMLIEGDAIRVVEDQGYKKQGQPSVLGMSFLLTDLPILKHMAETKKPLTLPYVKDNPDWVRITKTGWIESYTGAPIWTGEDVFGILNLNSSVPGYFNQTHTLHLQAFAHHASLAIANARLLKSERQQREVAEALQEAGLALSATLDSDMVMDQLLDQIARVVPYDTANIMVIDGEQTRTTHMRGYEQFGKEVAQDITKTSLNISTTANLHKMLQTQQPLLVADTAADPGWKKVAVSGYVRSWIGAPIVVQGQTVAFFSLDKIEPGFYTPNQAKLLAAFAGQASLSLENARLYKKEARRRYAAETLQKATGNLTATAELEEVLDNILIQLKQLIPYDSACIFLQEGDVLKAVAGRGFSDPKLVIGQTYPIDDELFQTVTKNKQPIRLTNAQKDARFKNWSNTQHILSWLGLPLIINQTCIGYLTIDNRQEAAYGSAETWLGQTFANQAAIAISNARLLAQTRSTLAQTEALYQATRTLLTPLSLPDMLQGFVDKIADILPANRVSLITLNSESRQINQFITGGPGASEIINVSFGELWDGLTGWVLRHLKPALSPKNHSDSRESLEVQQRRLDTNCGAIIVAPLYYHQQTFGTITAINQINESDFNSQDVDLLVAMANQASIAIANAQLFEQTQMALVDAESLYEVSRALIALESLPNLLQTITNQVANVLPATWVTVVTLDMNAQQATDIVTCGPEANITQIGIFEELTNGLTGWAIRKVKPALSTKEMMPDPRESLQIQQNRAANQFGSIIVVPVQYQGKILGTMTAVNRIDERDFTKRDVKVMLAMANQAAIALEKARLFSETRRRAEQLEILHQATQDLTILKDLDTLLRQISNRAMQLLNGDGGGIHLYQLEQDILEGVVTFIDQLRPETVNIKPGAGIIGQVWQTGRPVIVNDYKNWSKRLPDWVSDVPNTAIGVPIKWGDQFFGVLSVSAKSPLRQFTTEDTTYLSQFATQAAVAIENSRLYERIREHASQLELRVKERTFKLQALYELAYALGHATQLGDVLRLTLLQLYQTVPHAVSASLLLTDSKAMLIIQSQHLLSPQVETEIQTNLLNTLAQIKGVLVQADDLDVHRIQPKSETELNPTLNELGSLMTFPVLNDETATSILLVATEKGDNFDEEQVRLLHIVANQAAETIKRLQSLLAAEHQRLENLVEYLPNGLIMLDSDQRVVLANQAAKRLFSSVTPVEVGHKLSVLGPHALESVLQKAQTEPPFIIEIENTLKLVVEITAQPITSGPEAGGATLIIRDITEDRNIQRRIQQQERMAAVGQLAAGIAHDFNNILTSIIGYAELLLLDPNLSTSGKGDVQRITKQGHRAAHLVRQILDFSRQTITEKQSLDMTSFIKETIKLLERTIPEDIHITFDKEPGEYVIKADITQMQQALTNLAVNARDAMPNGGNLRFKLSQLSWPSGRTEAPHPDLTPGEWIVLTITDTGTGIPPLLQTQIFEPFFTTKEVGKGTGLGLAQVYGIIKQHEGHVDVTSQENIGTTFALYLPAFHNEQPGSGFDTTFNIPHGNNEVILLVEDDAAVLDITAGMLQHLGYKVLSATNGVKALELFNANYADIALVLTDLTMPKMGGAQLTQALQEIDPNTKVIALTGYPLDTEAKEVLAQGMVNWLQKPLSLKSLAQVIYTTLNTNP